MLIACQSALPNYILFIHISLDCCLLLHFYNLASSSLKYFNAKNVKVLHLDISRNKLKFSLLCPCQWGFETNSLTWLHTSKAGVLELSSFK